MVIWVLALALALDTALFFVWGLLVREARRPYWASAGWKALWFTEMAVLGWAASASLRSFTLLHFTCFLTGFYLQTLGIGQMARGRGRARTHGLIDFVFGIVALSVAILS